MRASKQGVIAGAAFAGALACVVLRVGCRGQIRIAPTDRVDISFIPEREILPVGDSIARYKRLVIRGDGLVEFYFLNPTPYRTRNVGDGKSRELLQELVDAGLLDVESDLNPTGTSSSEPLFPPDRYAFSGMVGGTKIDAQVSARSIDRKLVERFEELWKTLSRK